MAIWSVALRTETGSCSRHCSNLRGGEFAAQRDHVAIPHHFGQLAHRAGLENLPVVHDRNPVTELLGFFQVVRREEDRGALARNITDNLQNGIPGLRINPHGRFVQQQHLRPMHQADRQV